MSYNDPSGPESRLYPILYSLTSKGQTQTWQIETEGARFRTHEGILKGTITTSSWTECKGKNVGRSNETSPAEQADLEAAAKHKKKLESGYHEDVAQIAVSKYWEPMLAHKWQDYGDEVVFPVYSQPKLDGLRCVVTKDGMFSRNGKPIASAPHIWETLKHLFVANPSLVTDGELYNHQLKHDFNRIISLAKKTKPNEEDLAESAKHLEYWVYDCSPKGGGVFGDRLIVLEEIVESLSSKVVHMVETSKVTDQDGLDELYSEYLAQGFEGQMVRLDLPYENKRSKSLLKRKTFLDSEYELVDLEEGRGNLTGIAARAILKTKEGIQFEAGMIGSHEYCAELLRRKAEVIGQMATVVYQNLTPDGKPRFGKLKAIRYPNL